MVVRKAGGLVVRVRFSAARQEKVYADMQAAQAAAGASAGTGSHEHEAAHAGAAAKDDNVVDAEVKEVKKA